MGRQTLNVDSILPRPGVLDQRKQEKASSHQHSPLSAPWSRHNVSSCLMFLPHHRPAMMDWTHKLWDKAKFSFHRLLLSCIVTEMWRVIRHSLQCFMYGRIPKSRTLLSHCPNPNQSIPATVQPSLCVFIWHALLRDYHFPNSHTEQISILHSTACLICVLFSFT